MLDNITSVKFVVPLVACLAGGLAKTPAVAGVPEGAPAAIKQPSGSEVNSTKPGKVGTSAAELLAKSPAARTVEAGKVGTSAAKPVLAQFEPEPIQSPSTWYIGISGGWQNRERDTEAPPDTYTLFNAGYNLNGFIGHRFGDVRLEGEISYMRNPVRFVALGPGSTGRGSTALRAFMANLYYDIPFKNSRLKPYIGAGAGFYQSKLNGLSSTILSNNPPATGGPVIDTTSDQPFAYQIRAGISYIVSPKTELFLGYRYFHGNQLTLNTQFGQLRPQGGAVHNLEVGFRVNL